MPGCSRACLFALHAIVIPSKSTFAFHVEQEDTGRCRRFHAGCQAALQTLPADTQQQATCRVPRAACHVPDQRQEARQLLQQCPAASPHPAACATAPLNPKAVSHACSCVPPATHARPAFLACKRFATKGQRTCASTHKRSCYAAAMHRQGCAQNVMLGDEQAASPARAPVQPLGGAPAQSVPDEDVPDRGLPAATADIHQTAAL